MPRVYEKTKIRLGADRKCGRCGKEIKPGDRYLQWSFRYGGTHYRCLEHRPRPSELTQSKMGTVYAAQESLQDQLPGAESLEDIADLMGNLAEEVREVAEEYRDAAEAMGEAGYEHEERADELEYWADEIEGWDSGEFEDPDDDDPDADLLEDARQDAEGLAMECPL